MSLRILSYNIERGGGGREKAIASVITWCRPDVVILEEASRPDIVEKLASTCGMKAWGAVRGESLAFLSRIDVAEYTWHQIWFAKRQYLELVLGGSRARIFGVHLAAVHSNLTERRRAYELSSLLKSIAQRRQGFHVVTGDFNTLAPGEHLDVRRLPWRLRAMVYMTGRNIRWTTIQLMLDAGYADAYRIFHKDNGYSFPTWDPHVRLDYLFVPAASAPLVTECEVVRNAPAAREASDHFPLLSVVGV